MDAVRYKEQFVAFLKTMYPGGLPETDNNTISLRFNDKEFTFLFDAADCRGKSVKKSTKKSTPRVQKKKFEDIVTAEDLDWLRKQQIDAEEQPK